MTDEPARELTNAEVQYTTEVRWAVRGLPSSIRTAMLQILRQNLMERPPCDSRPRSTDRPTLLRMTGERSTPGGMSHAEYRDLYEGLYARAGSDFAAVPWAALRPHPGLLRWLDSHPGGRGQSALVVACGLGDDAEYAASRGFATTAFDFAPTAIQRCRERFPDSSVGYQVADLFALPESWSAAFDLVVEIRTLQSMPPDRRAAAVAAIARTVRPGGHVLVHTFVADETEQFDGPPWPVTPSQLDGFRAAGLRQVEGGEEVGQFPGATPRPVRALTAILQRPLDG